MASRRLAISSLLCDDPQPSELSQSPSHERAQHTAYSPQSPPYVEPKSQTPLAIAIQQHGHHHLTPSPPPVSQPSSPTRRAYLDDERPSSKHSRTMQHYTNSPPSPSSASPSSISPVQVYPVQHAPVSPYDQLPSSQSSAPSKNYYSIANASPPRPSLSPTTFHPQPVPPSGSNSSAPHRTTLPRPLPLSISTSLSLSPAVSQSAPYSGLEALVQAATEERERIDGDRHLGGGSGHNDARDGFASSSNVRVGTSPVLFRGDTLYRPSPSSPQPHPPSHSTYGNDREHHADHYLAERIDVHVRPSKKRRSMPEVEPEDHPHDHIAHPAYPISSPSQRQAPVYAYPKSDSPSHLLAPSTSTHKPACAPAPVDASQPLPVAMSMPVPASSPLSAHAHAHAGPGQSGRRTPPRSKPKAQRKPGSVVVDAREGDERKRTTVEYVSKKSGNRPNETVPIPDGSVQRLVDQAGDMWPQPRDTADKKTEAKAKNAKKEEEEEEDEQDVHDFFLSAFESPRRSNEKLKRKEKDEEMEKADEMTNSSRMFSSSPAPMPTSAAVHHIKAKETKESGTLTPLRALERDLGLGYESARTGPAIDAHIDLDGVLAAAAHSEIGAAAEIDAMEVDVEAELLSLLDDRPHVSPSIPATVSALMGPVVTADSQRKPSALRAEGQGSMPPPPALTGHQTKATKRAGSVGAFAKNGMGNKGEGPETKPEKVKRAPKARSKPGASTTVKSKASSKPTKDKAKDQFASPMASHLSLLTAPTLMDSFPNVTSSGRMVTKTKKSAAAAVGAGAKVGSASGSASPFPVPAGPSGQGGKRKTSGVGTAVESSDMQARSRSHSVMPRDSVGPEAQREKADVEEGAGDEEEDNKLYCVCKNPYDEDRVMIACDRCDEWYHTQCVNMPDLEVDLVDQFICPLCVTRNPDLPIQTTYKSRCFTGLKHPVPASSDACHKPARGTFSKYCSDECGVRFMQTKIQTWACKGGDVSRLWESVKDAKRREGVVVCEPGRILPKAIDAEIQNDLVVVASDKNDRYEDKSTVVLDGPKLLIAKGKRDIGRLQAQLNAIVLDREDKKKEMESILWRERLLELAMERSERVLDECGWDQRLCFGDEEWAEFGDGVLESYEEVSGGGMRSDEQNEAMQVDGQSEEGEWWCRGKKKCERHSGWQKLRTAEVTFEKEIKEAALAKLTTREREVRKRIEDIIDPQAHTSNVVSVSKTTLKQHQPRSCNGTSQRRAVDGDVKKGKKKSSS